MDFHGLLGDNTDAIANTLTKIKFKPMLEVWNYRDLKTLRRKIRA